MLLRRKSFRARIAIFIVGISVCFFFFIFLLKLLEDDAEMISRAVNDHGESHEWSGEHPIVLWWTPFTGQHGITRKCGKEICYFTDQREHFLNSFTKVLLFYGSDFKPTDLPVPRLPDHDWALLHEESPKNNYLFSFPEVINLFNHTATFRRESDFPLTLQYIDSLVSLTSESYYVPTTTKNSKLNELAPVVYIQSDCNTPTNRDFYIEKLMKYIKIDSYGKCLHNKDLPPRLADSMSTFNDPTFYKIISQYKFTLSFENAVCEDYITEKLWRPLITGSVPIYYGAPTVKDWLPNENSAILVTDFSSPEALAHHLLNLNANDAAYESYLEHKTHKKLTNKRLVEALSTRKWGIDNDPIRPNFIEEFECMVCERVSKNHKRKARDIPILSHKVHLEHYGCPKPDPLLSTESDSQDWWLELYTKARREAIALQNLMKGGKNFTATDFYQEVIRLLENEEVAS